MSAFKKGTEIQIDCREPSFTGIEKRVQLIFIQAGTAAMGIDRKFPAVQTQIPGMDLVDILRQSVGKHTKKICNMRFAQQMKIINKNVVRGLTAQGITKLISKHPRTGSI